ncbi:hypothetical protein E0Z10_g5117 [Xylaria hypoxylon]|uniref:Uncharacterized protein n=1 Tax=Xylaria hypoxylon TaxID=37992 RepID=A0A4Z0YJL2_9PEZI|nr:hypothetical protein E0Z10_g5117 [Xylaria hypoxylon]
MPYYRSRRRFRLSHANVRESRPSRRHIEEYENRFSATGNEEISGQAGLDYSQSGWRSPSWVEDPTAVPDSDDSVPPDLAMWEPEWPALGISGIDRAFSSNNYYSPFTSREPVRDGPPIAYQQPYGHLQDPVSPATSPPADRVAASFIGSAYNQTGSIPSSGYHPDQGWTVPAPLDWTSEVDVPSGQQFRRLSTRARQGSDIELYAETPHDNHVIPSSTNQPEAIEENDRSDSSGGTTPVDRDQYIVDCMSGDVPWSPEFPHQSPHDQYPYRFHPWTAGATR